jgi:hypothetical protein
LKVVKSAPPTVTPGLSSHSVTYGDEQVETFSVTVKTPAGSEGTPTGKATVKDGATTLCTITLATGKGSCSLTAIQLTVTGATPDKITIHYTGDNNYPVATSGTQTLAVTAEATSAAVTPSVSSVAYGDLKSVTFSVTVTPQFAGTPTGSVLVEQVLGTEVKDLCTIAALSSAKGTCHPSTGTLLTASPDAYSIVAVYTATGNFVSSTSPGAPLTVTSAQSTTTTLTVTPASAVYGDETTVTFSAKVSPQFTGVPTGTVDIDASVHGKTVLVCAITLTGGRGTCKPSSGEVVPTGTLAVTAKYVGDSNFSGSTSAPGTWKVTAATTSTTVSVAPSATAYGSETTAVFTATVKPQFGGVPTGTVKITAPGGATVCTATLVTGRGTCSPASGEVLAVAPHYTLTGTYSGDTNFATSSGTTGFGVTAGPTATSVTSSANPSVPGETLTFTATVTGLAGSGTPTGTVTFAEGGTVLCAGAPVTAEKATCTETIPVTPSQTITASYSGDADHLPSSGSFVQDVRHGYWMVAANGGIYAFGDAAFYGSMAGKPLNAPMVGIAATPDGNGYWTVASDGGIFSYGDAKFYGSTGSLKLNKPVVGMESTPDGKGYWLVASDGGVFSFGDAKFYGSTGSIKLNKPVIGLVATHDGGGYWLIASDGGVFAFGDAKFVGSTGNLVTQQPIVGLAPMPTGAGYWLATGAGGVYAFGTAKFYGSLGSSSPGTVIAGMGGTSDGGGYWLVSTTGAVFHYGDAIYDGGLTSGQATSPIVDVADI